MIAALLLVFATQVAPTWGLEVRLVDPDGAALDAVRLVLDPLDGQSDGPRELRLTSDAGRFRVSALEEGRWRPRLAHFGPSLEGVRFDPPEIVVPGPPLRLVADVASVRLETEFRGSGVFCVQLADATRDGGLDAGTVRGGGDRGRRYLLPPGAKGVLGVWWNECGLVEQPFEIAEAARRAHSVVMPELPPSSPPGRVRVRVPRLETQALVRLSVLAPLSRYELVRRWADWSDPGSSHFDLRLPPGDYVLRVDDTEMRDSCMVDTTWRRHVARPIEVPLHVRSGSSVALDLAWSTGVRPRLAFEAPGAEDIRVWELDELDRPLRPVDWEPLDASFDWREHPAWVPGRAHPTREPLPTGRVRLLAGARGFAPRIVELDLVEDAPCAARIALSALERDGE